MAKRLLLVLIPIAAFVALALYLVRSAEPRPAQVKIGEPVIIRGEVDFVTPEDITVDTVKLRLCGVRQPGGHQARQIVLDTIRSRYNKRWMRCTLVGTNSTPCDGIVPSKVGSRLSAQCSSVDGGDLAEALIADGLLCGIPNGPYRECD